MKRQPAPNAPRSARTSVKPAAEKDKPDKRSPGKVAVKTAVAAPPHPPGRPRKEVPKLIPPKEFEDAIAYVDHVCSRISHRTANADPPPQLFHSNSPVAQSISSAGSSASIVMPLSLAPESASNSAGALIAQSALKDIGKFTNELLRWFSILELQTPPKETDLEYVSKNVDTNAELLVTAIGKLQRQLLTTTIEAAQVFVKMSENVFSECRKQVSLLHSHAQLIAKVRQAVRSRNLQLAIDVVQEFSMIPKNPAGPNTPISPRQRIAERVVAQVSGDGASSMPVAPPLPPSAPPLLAWLARSWIPAMRQWSEIVGRANEAAKSVEPEEIKDAVTETHKDVIAKSADLEEILQPGESLAQLVDEHISIPLNQKVDALTKKKQVLSNLRAAIEMKGSDFTRLSNCIVAAQALELDTVDDQQLLATARTMQIDIQRVAKVTIALSMAIRAQADLFKLIRAIVSANQLMFSMGLACDPKACAAAVELGNRLLAAPVTAAYETLEQTHADALFLEHVPSSGWAPELSVLYQEACHKMSQLLEHRSSQAEVERVLPRFRKVLSTAEPPSSSDIASVRSLLMRCDDSDLQSSETAELAALFRSATELQVKVHFEGSLRVINIHDDAKGTFSTVAEQLAQCCAETKSAALGWQCDPVSFSGRSLRVRYQDEDGDFITILDQSDWSTFRRRQALSASGMSRVELYCDYLQDQPTTPIQQKQQPTPTRVGPGRTGRTPPPHPPPQPQVKPPVVGATAAAAAAVDPWPAPPSELDLHTIASIETSMEALEEQRAEISSQMEQLRKAHGSKPPLPKRGVLKARGPLNPNPAPQHGSSNQQVESMVIVGHTAGKKKFVGAEHR